MQTKVTEILKSYGAKPLVRGGKFLTLEGEKNIHEQSFGNFQAMSRLSNAMTQKNIRQDGL